MSLLPETAQLEALLGEEPRLRALARALVDDPVAADEAVYETLEWSAERLLPKGGFRRYLGRAVRSRIINRLRSERRRRHYEHQAATREALPSTIDVVAQAEIRHELTAAVARLPEPYRSTIWLRYYEDLPPRKISERMDVPSNTVRTRVRTGLEQLRRALDARHNGDRRAWTACLMPWAIRGKQTTTLTTGILGAILMKKFLVSATAVLLVLLAIWMGASLGEPATPSSTEALAGGQLMTGDLGTEPDASRTPLPEPPPAEAPQISGRLFHYDGRPAVGVPYGTFSDGPDRPEWTRVPESPVFVESPSPLGFRQWYPSAATTSDGGWILPAGMTPPAVVSFEIEGDHVASFEISPDSHDLILPEFVSVEVYLSGYTPGDTWSIHRSPRSDDGLVPARGSFTFGHFVRDAGSCALAIRKTQENYLFDNQGDSFSIPALRGQKMTLSVHSAGFQAIAQGDQWWPEVTAPGIVTFSVTERWPVITVELLEWDRGPRAKLVVEANSWPEKSPPPPNHNQVPRDYLQFRSGDGVTQFRVTKPETDMRLVLRTEEGESFSTNFRMKEGEMSQTISFIRGKGTMAQEILLPVGASLDSVKRLQVESPSPATGDLEWTWRENPRGTYGDVEGIREFGVRQNIAYLREPTLYRTAQGLLVGDLPKGWTQMIVVMKDNRLARVLPGLPLRANWFEPLEILLPEGVSADQLWYRGMAVQYRQPGTSEPSWTILRPLSRGSGVPSGQGPLLSQLPERWTQILLLVKEEEPPLGRFARVLPESFPLTAQWLPEHALDRLAPIDLKALREAHALDVSRGRISLCLEPWGIGPLFYEVVGFVFGPDTEEWPVWKLRVPQGISYHLWLWDYGRPPAERYLKLPAPRLR